VANVLITHYHPDHIGGLAEVSRKTGSAVHAHPLEAELVRSGAPSPPVEPRSFLARLAIGLFGSKGTDPSTVDRELAAGEDLPIAGGITAIHTPGHTPGHTSYLWLEGGVLFAGDAASNLLGQLGPAPADEDPGGGSQLRPPGEPGVRRGPVRPRPAGGGVGSGSVPPGGSPTRRPVGVQSRRLTD
jgi:glyoxylase-like metal-dependent hydrolase (beta-lactamase superfamily II)